MPCYRFFHRSLDSGIPLESLPQGGEPGDLALRVEEVEVLRDHPARGRLLRRETGRPPHLSVVRRTPRALHVYSRDVPGAILLRLEPRRWTVRVEPHPDLAGHAERALFTVAKKYLLGEAGEVFLHASCAARQGAAAAFVGPAGAGKSTLAAALAAFREYGLFADDAFPWVTSGVAIEVHQGSLLTQFREGSPLEDAVAWPGFAPVEVAVKSVRRAPAVEPGRARLVVLFLLETGPWRVTPLDRAEALLALLPFFGAGFRRLGPGDLGRLRELVDRVPVHRLAAPRDRPLEETAAAVDRLVRES